MAAIRNFGKNVVVLSGDRICSFLNGIEDEVQLAAKKEEPKVKTKQKEDSVEDEEKIVVCKKNCVLATAVSTSGKYLAVADDQSQFHLFAITETKLELISTRHTARRCTAVSFSHSERDVVLADRTGDVYRFSLTNPSSDAELLLGHLSMVLDVVLTRDDEFIVTADRDEKIRVSKYPNAYNIHSFCLLHTEYVSQLLHIADQNLIVSGSGDGRLAVWTVEGKNLCGSQQVKGHDQGLLNSNGEFEGRDGAPEDEAAGVKKMVYDEALSCIAVIYYRCTFVHMYSLQDIDDQSSCKLCKSCDIAFVEEPWDVSFDAAHRLWVLKPSEVEPVLVYTCRRETPTLLNVSKATDLDESCQNIVSRLSSNWDFFKASLDSPQWFMLLQKQRTSANVDAYMERKQDRIKGLEKAKEKPPAEKKQKTS